MWMPNSVPTRRIRREHVVALDRVEALGGLVEQHQHGVVDDRLRQLHPLALTGRHRADRSHPLLAQADLPQHVAGPAGGLAAGQPVQLGDVADEVDRLDVRRQRVVLGRVADPLADLGAGRRGVEAEDPQLAVRRAGGGRAATRAGWSCRSRSRRAGR